MRAYESRTDTYEDVAARFAIGPATLLRWVQRQREIGTLDPLAKAGLGVTGGRVAAASTGLLGDMQTDLKTTAILPVFSA